MKNKVDKRKVIVLAVIIIAIPLIFFFTRPKDCGSNERCFDSYAASCTKTIVSAENNGNNYMYEILGSKKENCIIQVTMQRVSESQPYDMKIALEGKSMKCAIQKTTLQTSTLSEIENLNDYCTGQLKEAVLQITLDKMYDIIIQNIGPLSEEFAQQLKN